MLQLNIAGPGIESNKDPLKLYWSSHMIYLLNQQSLIDHWGINGLSPEKKVAYPCELTWACIIVTVVIWIFIVINCKGYTVELMESVKTSICFFISGSMAIYNIYIYIAIST